MARRKDAMDLLLEMWAKVARQLRGNDKPRLASQIVGSPRCTLSKIRELHDGAASFGARSQHFPEVYPPHLVPVNRAIKHAPYALQDIAEWRYVRMGLRDKTKARMMGLDLPEYWDRVDRLKDHIEAWLAGQPDPVDIG